VPVRYIHVIPALWASAPSLEVDIEPLGGQVSAAVPAKRSPRDASATSQPHDRDRQAEYGRYQEYPFHRCLSFPDSERVAVKAKHLGQGLQVIVI
jgi:hypothetical protein